MATSNVFNLADMPHLPASILNSRAVVPDPAHAWPGAPPGFGKNPVPHIYTVAGFVGSAARTYPNYDEATRNSRENAKAMRNDTLIAECLEGRQRAVALLPWHLQPEDEKDQKQKALVAELTTILERTYRFTEMRRTLMESIWYGRYMSALTYGVRRVRGTYRKIITHHEPRHGDKLVFRYDDGTCRYEAGQVGIRVHASMNTSHPKQVEATQHGLVYFLKEHERRTCIVHKHMIEDSEYEDVRGIGSIHGVGIRDRIYWTWAMAKEVEANLLEYIERTALGIELWRYPSGNAEAEKDARKAAQERVSGGRSIVMVPVMPGEDADLFGVEHIEPGPGGAELLKTICQEFYGHRMKRYILGQVLSSEAEATGLGSGVAEAHMATFSDIIRYDSRNLEETMTEDMVKVVLEENFPKWRGCHIRFILDTDRPESQEKLEAAYKAWQMGLKIKAADLYTFTGLSKPDEEDEVLLNPQIAGPQGGPPGAGGDPSMFPPMGEAGAALDQLGQAQDEAGAAMGMEPQGQAPLEVQKDAVGQPIAPQPVNPWQGFWESLFQVARQRPAGTNGNGAPSPALASAFQRSFHRYVKAGKSKAQFRADLEAALDAEDDKETLGTKFAFLLAWHGATPKRAEVEPSAVHRAVHRGTMKHHLRKGTGPREELLRALKSRLTAPSDEDDAVNRYTAGDLDAETLERYALDMSLL